MVEKRHVIESLAGEGCMGSEIHQHLQGYCEQSAMSRGELYRWIGDIEGQN
jgi:hypothetical protein